MTGGRAARFIGIVAALAIVAACARPNAGGWWDQGTHAVDGYWVTEERPCEPETDEQCTAAIEVATSILQTEFPGATITGAVTAGYPTRRGRDPSEMTINLGGLHKPKFVVFDIAGGPRHTIGLTCGPDLDVQAMIRPTVCWETEFEVWRVGGS
jgi:hypothetical protein